MCSLNDVQYSMHVSVFLFFFFWIISHSTSKNTVNSGGYTAHLGSIIKLTMINGFISSAEWLPYLRNFQSMHTVLIHPLSCRLKMSGYKAKPFLYNSPQTPRRNQVAVTECFIDSCFGLSEEEFQLGFK